MDGTLFSLLNIRGMFNYGYKKAVYYKLKYGLTLESVLDRLVQNSQVINIQEHSSPMREDDKHQKPNLVDDISNIRYILKYLQKYDLWYATGHEIAEYWKTYQNTSVVLDGKTLVVNVDRPKRAGVPIWIALTDVEGKNLVLQSDNEVIHGNKDGTRYLFELRPQNTQKLRVVEK